MEERNLITDNGVLRTWCERWQQLPMVAIDTEFVRVTTFYPKSGLIQVADGEHCCLIDPLAITDNQPFIDLLQNQKVVKVLHACLEDIDLFKQSLNAIPSPIFDTQIAAAFLGFGFSIGYQRLVQAMLGISLEKGETRSDWLQRPLSEAQLHYAVLDVKYLPEIYVKQIKLLTEKSRLSWVEEECEIVLNEAQCWDDIEHHYLKIKSAWKLNRRALAVLKALYIWRDQEARVRNVPRSYVLKENTLWPLACFQPSTLHQLNKIEDMTPRRIQQEGEAVLAVIEQALTIPDDLCPPLLPKPFSESMGNIMKKIKRLVDQRAQELDIAPEVLVRRKQITELLMSGEATGRYQLPPSLQGWRAAIIGDELLAILNAASLTSGVTP